MASVILLCVQMAAKTPSVTMQFVCDWLQSSGIITRGNTPWSNYGFCCICKRLQSILRVIWSFLDVDIYILTLMISLLCHSHSSECSCNYFFISPWRHVHEQTSSRQNSFFQKIIKFESGPAHHFLCEHNREEITQIMLHNHETVKTKALAPEVQMQLFGKFPN